MLTCAPSSYMTTGWPTGVQLMVDSLLGALPALCSVMTVYILVLFFFGLVGLTLFAGRYRQSCINDADEVQPDFDPPCSTGSWYGVQCAEGYTCQDSGFNPNFGVTSFDNIAISFVTIVQQMSLEGWTDNMYAMEKALGRAYVQPPHAPRLLVARC
jgi:hypothetical protein